MSKTLFAYLFALSVFIPAIPSHGQVSSIKKEVAYLVDSIGNRYPGSAGDTMAQKHIEDRFEQLGMKCLAFPFDIIEEQWSNGTLRLQKDTMCLEFNPNKDFSVNSRSPETSVLAEYVVIGDTLPDSLQKALNNRIVVSIIRPTRDRRSNLLSITDIIDAGAKAIIFVTPPDGKINQIKSKGNRNHQIFPIPILSISHDNLDILLTGASPDTISSGLLTQPPGLIRIETQHNETHLETANIIGIKKGTEDRTIIIGAHFDTLPPDPETGMPKPGANDNASGIATMMELAKRIHKKDTKHNIVFVAFSGEEKGALGSMHFIRQLQEKNIIVDEMINLDMVGRMEDGILFYRQFNGTMISPETVTSKITLAVGKDNLSDHFDFVNKGFPVTYFSTGDDEDMHTAFDNSDRLNYKGMSRIVKLLEAYIARID